MVIIFPTPFFSAMLRRISPVLSIPRGVSSEFLQRVVAGTGAEAPDARNFYSGA